MKNAATLATVVFLLGTNAGGVLATCYGSGESWYNDELRQNARNAAYDFCNGGALSGYWAPGEAKNACAQLTSTLMVNFLVHNLNAGAGFVLRPQDCVLRLHNEINGCWRGGQSDVAGWRFRSDPNNGAC